MLCYKHQAHRGGRAHLQLGRPFGFECAKMGQGSKEKHWHVEDILLIF